MAFIIENVALNKTSGIGIDTHMHRMFNELRWVKSKNPEQTRVQLESWLPDEYWGSVNVLWVGLGQEVQQFKPKIIEKALKCSRPADALRLLKRLGVDIKKEGEKLLLTDQIRDAMSQ
jgi:endonuclease III